MACAINEDSSSDLGDDCDGLDAERVSVYSGLGEALFVVLQPEEKHALEGKGFEHGANDRKGGKDVAVEVLVLGRR